MLNQQPSICSIRSQNNSRIHLEALIIIAGKNELKPYDVFERQKNALIFLAMASTIHSRRSNYWIRNAFLRFADSNSAYGASAFAAFAAMEAFVVLSPALQCLAVRCQIVKKTIMAEYSIFYFLCLDPFLSLLTFFTSETRVTFVTSAYQESGNSPHLSIFSTFIILWQLNPSFSQLHSAFFPYLL